MLNLFKIVGWFEGLSLLTLFGYAMPLKYMYGDPSLVRLVGSIHGGLFLTYGFIAFMLSDKYTWSRKHLGLAIGLSCLPFGTFVFERKFLPVAVPVQNKN